MPRNFRTDKNMFVRMRKLVEAGVIKSPPLSYQVMSKIQPRLHSGFKTAKPGVVDFEIDNLRTKYIERFSSVKDEVIRLVARPGVAAHSSDRFISRQFELMKEKGMNEDESFTAVTEEFRSERIALAKMRQIQTRQALDDGLTMGKTIIEEIQDSELEYVKKARQIFGPPDFAQSRRSNLPPTNNNTNNNNNNNN